MWTPLSDALVKVGGRTTHLSTALATNGNSQWADLKMSYTPERTNTDKSNGSVCPSSSPFGNREAWLATVKNLRHNCSAFGRVYRIITPEISLRGQYRKVTNKSWKGRRQVTCSKSTGKIPCRAVIQNRPRATSSLSSSARRSSSASWSWATSSSSAGVTSAYRRSSRAPDSLNLATQMILGATWRMSNYRSRLWYKAPLTVYSVTVALSWAVWATRPRARSNGS